MCGEQRNLNEALCAIPIPLARGWEWLRTPNLNKKSCVFRALLNGVCYQNEPAMHWDKVAETLYLISNQRGCVGIYIGEQRKRRNLFTAERSLRLLCALLISHRCRNAPYRYRDYLLHKAQTLFAERFARACIRYQIFTFHLVRAAIHPQWAHAPMKILSLLRPLQRFANICARWLLERDPSGNVCLGGTSRLLPWDLINIIWFHSANMRHIFAHNVSLWINWFLCF
jgi:hypothetical protein